MDDTAAVKVIDIFKMASLPVYTGEQLKEKWRDEQAIAGYQSIRDGLTMFLKEVVDRWKVLDENYVDVERIVDKFIEIKMGDIKDFPHELYETIHHILYEYFGLLKEATHPGWLPSKVKKSKDIRTGLECFIKERAELQSTVDQLPNLLKELRNLPISERDYAVRMVLDQIKFGIKNVGYKPEFIRIVERKWKSFKNFW